MSRAAIAAATAAILAADPCRCGFCRAGERVPSLKVLGRKVDRLTAAFAATEEASAAYYLSHFDYVRNADGTWTNRGRVKEENPAASAKVEAGRKAAYQAMADAQVLLAWANNHAYRIECAEERAREERRRNHLGRAAHYFFSSRPMGRWGW